MRDPVSREQDRIIEQGTWPLPVTPIYAYEPMNRHTFEYHKHTTYLLTAEKEKQ